MSALKKAFPVIALLGMLQILVAEETEFQLPATTGDVVSCNAASIENGAVVCFLGNECPLAKLYSARLSAMQSEFNSQGIDFYGINSNQQDSMAELKAFKANLNVSFPLLKDYDNKVADQYAAKRTPEVFLLGANGKVIYQGAIDDQYSPGVVRDCAKSHYLRDAIQQLLGKKPVSKPETEPEGCLIGRVKTPIKNPTVTYCNQVSKLFQSNCVECHRPGQIGPFALQDYDEAKGWAEMIVEVVNNGRMPPWHATDEHLEFRNARKLSTADKKILRDWLAQGTPYGDANELPKKRSYPTGWQLPQAPDAVVEMSQQPFTVPADGTVEYQYFVVDPGFEEDKWVTAASVLPGNFAVVHHCIVFVRPPDGSDFDGIGWLAAYVPGMGPALFKPNYARRIPAGSKLVFQMHYTPNGVAATDLTKIGLVFGQADAITQQVFTIAALNQEFEIPATTNGHVVETELPFIPQKSELISFTPHMHYRGKSFESTAISQNGRQQLINVPNYDFNWQHVYQLKSPLNLSDVKTVHCRFTFDNSDQNPFNPDPSQQIYWGDQTWEEMAVAFFHVAKPKNQKPDRKKSAVAALASADILSQQNEKAQKFVDDYFAKFDADNDGVLNRDETPQAIQHFRFYKYDSNRDRSLSKEELLSVVRNRFK